MNKMIKLLWNKYVNTEDDLEFLHAQVTLQKKKKIRLRLYINKV